MMKLWNLHVMKHGYVQALNLHHTLLLQHAQTPPFDFISAVLMGNMLTCWRKCLGLALELFQMMLI